jgi:hypothetical protein
VVLDEILDTRNTTSSKVSDTPLITIDETPSNIMLHRSGRTIKALDRFIGETNVAIFDELKSYPSTYDEG